MTSRPTATRPPYAGSPSATRHRGKPSRSTGKASPDKPSRLCRRPADNRSHNRSSVERSHERDSGRVRGNRPARARWPRVKTRAAQQSRWSSQTGPKRALGLLLSRRRTMTRIIIDAVVDIEYLANVIAVVMRASRTVRRTPSKSSTSPRVGPLSRCQSPRSRRRCRKFAATVGGTHLRVTECWPCWCDGCRGAALDPEVLTVETWDVAVGNLITGHHRAVRRVREVG